MLDWILDLDWEGSWDDCCESGFAVLGEEGSQKQSFGRLKANDLIWMMKLDGV